MSNFWDSSVWGPFNLMAVLLCALLAASLIKKNIKILEESLIPTSVLGGTILLLLSAVFKLCTGSHMFESNFYGGNGASVLEIITYHALALGFIASTFTDSKNTLGKERQVEIFNTGLTTVSSYMIQAIGGMGFTMLLAKFMKDIFPVSGVLLCFGFGQGTGQALNYGNIYETQYGFIGGKSFGLTIAAFGFLCASFGGVFYLSYLRRSGKVDSVIKRNATIRTEKNADRDEVPVFESMDTLSVQLAFVMGAYLITYLIMFVLGNLLPGLKAVIYGFNFLIGVLAATVTKSFVYKLYDKKVLKKKYMNTFLMTRIRNFFFDLMVVAGIAAIQLNALGNYLWILIALGVIGLVLTYIYNHFVANLLFKDYSQEQFLGMFGMLCGTASTGIILLREVDPDFNSPVADNMVYQNFPAILFGFPLMILATMAPEQPMLSFGILVGYFIVLNIILFRSKIFKRKNK
ncbi:MAG: hypothetical protein IKY94_08620 [Lachnospiraceae bacterium]|nr:hypothetical protein [Lachnospiraceae bacterium]